MPILLAETTSGSGLDVLASLTMGSALALLGWWIYQVLQSEDLQQGDQWRYDVSRINELRRADVFYRVFHPAVKLLAGINRRVLREGLPAINREIQAAGLSRFWMAEEYLAKAELIALLLGPLYAYLFVSMAGGGGWFMALMAIVLTVWIIRHRLARRARYRLLLIKRRMPFLLDLLTLLMEAGATFLNSLKQAVSEFHGHPVAEEFGRVLNDINMGKTRAEAFAAMRQRLSDDEITSIITSILQGEQLGTPLAKIFRTQADVLRLKRTQRAEAVAGEAGVNMLLPGVMIMAATVIIIIGPFALNFFKFNWGM